MLFYFIYDIYYICYEQDGATWTNCFNAKQFARVAKEQALKFINRNEKGNAERVNLWIISLN